MSKRPPISHRQASTVHRSWGVYLLLSFTQTHEQHPNRIRRSICHEKKLPEQYFPSTDLVSHIEAKDTATGRFRFLLDEAGCRDFEGSGRFRML